MNQDLIEYALAGEDFSKPYFIHEIMSMFHGINIINTGEVLERAISNKTKLKQQSRNKQGSDFEDGSESKYTTVFYDKSSAYASIGGIKNKTGTIRALVYDEKKTKKTYYFLISYDVYSQYFKDGKKSTLKIFFDKETGKPRTPVFNTNPNLWECKVTKQKFFSYKQK